MRLCSAANEAVVAADVWARLPSVVQRLAESAANTIGLQSEGGGSDDSKTGKSRCHSMLSVWSLGSFPRQQGTTSVVVVDAIIYPIVVRTPAYDACYYAAN